MGYCCNTCGARLLGFDYWSLELTTGRVIAVCERCKREIFKRRGEMGLPKARGNKVTTRREP